MITAFFVCLFACYGAGKELWVKNKTKKSPANIYTMHLIKTFMRKTDDPPHFVLQIAEERLMWLK